MQRNLLETHDKTIKDKVVGLQVEVKALLDDFKASV